MFWCVSEEYWGIDEIFLVTVDPGGGGMTIMSCELRGLSRCADGVCSSGGGFWNLPKSTGPGLFFNKDVSVKAGGIGHSLEDGDSGMAMVLRGLEGFRRFFRFGLCAFRTSTRPVVIGESGVMGVASKAACESVIPEAASIS